MTITRDGVLFEWYDNRSVADINDPEQIINLERIINEGESIYLAPDTADGERVPITDVRLIGKPVKTYGNTNNELIKDLSLGLVGLYRPAGVAFRVKLQDEPVPPLK